MVYTGLKENQDREAFLKSLYQQAFPSAARYIGRMGGSMEEARDVFQDALVIYYEQVMVAGKISENQPKAYLLGISKHLWNKRYREMERNIPLPDVLKGLDEEADQEYREVSSSRLMRLLQTAGRKCMELLSAFYYEKLPMEQLAGRYGFSGSRSATVQKFKCLEKVKDTVKQKSLSYEDILE